MSAKAKTPESTQDAWARIMREAKKKTDEALDDTLKQLQGLPNMMDEDRVRELIGEQLKGAIIKPVTIQIKAPKKPTKKVDKAHYNFDKLVRMVGNCRLNVALVGESGTGKTHGALQLGEALGMKTWLQPFSPSDRKHEVKGFLDANGRFHAPAIKNAYVDGGLLILDEYDKANPEVAVAMNALLSGDTYLFADNKMYTKHKDFLVVACQNTTGVGTSKRYSTARNQDASLLNRFVRLDWDTDEGLETAICGNTVATRAVQQMRKNARNLSMDSLVISPRQSIHANKLMEEGFSIKDALEYSILLGLADDVKKRLMADVKLS